MPAFAAEFGMPVRVDLFTEAPRRSEKFLKEILGWRFVGGDGGRRFATLQGMPHSLIQPVLPAGGTGDEAVSQWRVSFHVDDVAGTVDRAKKLGATVAQEPVDLVAGGQMAVIADPGGALVGLLGPDPDRRFYIAGEPGAPVWFELVVTAGEDFAKVVEFYHELFGWDVTVHVQEDTVGYAVAEEEDAAFAGIAGVDETGGSGAPAAPWTGWTAYLGVEDLEKAVTVTVDRGGTVLSGPSVTEFGPLAVIADPVGAVTVLCEVPPPPADDGSRESDSLLDLDMFNEG